MNRSLDRQMNWRRYTVKGIRKNGQCMPLLCAIDAELRRIVMIFARVDVDWDGFSLARLGHTTICDNRANFVIAQQQISLWKGEIFGDILKNVTAMSFWIIHSARQWITIR